MAEKFAASADTITSLSTLSGIANKQCASRVRLLVISLKSSIR